MPSVTQVKKEMDFNSDLKSILGVMKGIATAQFLALEEQYRQYDAFSTAIESFFDLMDPKLIKHPFVVEGAPAGVIAITSDQGLLGGMNLQVILTALDQMGDGNGTLIVVGERGQRYAAERGFSVIGFPGVDDDKRLGQALQVRDYAMDLALRKQIGSLKVVYSRAISFTQQRISILPVLPCTAWASGGKETAHREFGHCLIESSLGSMVEYLVYLWLGQRLYEAMGLSRLAELGARAAHLEGSEQELERRAGKLRLEYFRKKHEIIDQNMRELFGARVVFGEKS
ncbi:MAG: F0F1 ATP synthase subunit gamma [Candidatus Omnitrophica bacterium]|nr:F0F1 ATP synthase subunit gamma [Candidatus Omnitrophota bacterium]